MSKWWALVPRAALHTASTATPSARTAAYPNRAGAARRTEGPARGGTAGVAGSVTGSIIGRSRNRKGHADASYRETAWRTPHRTARRRERSATRHWPELA
ncbi:hypothetical protein GCM10010358_64180 [Streptomyces minutiscleroticus]|uniref:Uncharacterized protein n=1 Tax=Streptomyces minutiscleroticus TaxID=68238 RepID=A0A918U670_9ACTN|nr:hypothetical protein GCM10010358_64180 [Streptomyces minutiscleroticus]